MLDLWMAFATRLMLLAYSLTCRESFALVNTPEPLLEQAAAGPARGGSGFKSSAQTKLKQAGALRQILEQLEPFETR
jgi:hypothetical protein